MNPTYVKLCQSIYTRLISKLLKYRYLQYHSQMGCRQISLRLGKIGKKWNSFNYLYNCIPNWQLFTFMIDITGQKCRKYFSKYGTVAKWVLVKTSFVWRTVAKIDCFQHNLLPYTQSLIFCLKGIFLLFKFMMDNSLLRRH